MSRVILLITFLAVMPSSVIVSGCQQEPIILPAEPIIPENFTTYREESGLFSITYPDDWRTEGVGDWWTWKGK